MFLATFDLQLFIRFRPRIPIFSVAKVQTNSESAKLNPRFYTIIVLVCRNKGKKAHKTPSVHASDTLHRAEGALAYRMGSVWRECYSKSICMFSSLSNEVMSSPIVSSATNALSPTVSANSPGWFSWM